MEPMIEADGAAGADEADGADEAGEAGDKSYMRYCQYKGSAGYSYIYRDTLTHSTLLTCAGSGAVKSAPTVNGTG